MTIVINELDADQTGTDAGEFVELFGPANASLNGLTLVFYNGSNDLSYASFDLDGYTLDANGYFVAGNAGVANVDLTFAGNFLQNGQDAVALYLGDAASFPNNTAVTTTGLVDAVVYDTDDADDPGLLVLLNAGEPQLNENGGGDGTGHSLQRSPDGEGGARVTSDFITAAPTPGTANAEPPPPPPPATPYAIYEIQGEAHVSPKLGEIVVTEGVVTAVDSNGFYIQDPTGDGNDATSDGIFVFTSSAPTVTVGQAVTIEGTVAEFIPGGASTNNLSVTQIAPSEITVDGIGSVVATVIGAGGRTPPTATIDDDGLTTYDPEADGIDFWESLEGMLVTGQDLVSVAPTALFSGGTNGEIFSVTDNGAGAGDPSLADRGAIAISDGDYNPERVQIQLDSGVQPGFFDGGVVADAYRLDAGSTIGDVTGVVRYDFGNYEIVARDLFTPTENLQQAETTALAGSESDLLIATYNVLNLDPNDLDGDADVANARFDALADQIVNNLNAPDILALQEIQDNSGTANDGTTSASATLQALIDSIAAAGGPAYEFIEIAPVDGTSGGAPGGNIRVAYLYNPDRVTLIEDSVEAITGAAFDDSRLPLVASFLFGDEEVTLINNHASSRSGSSPLFGALQPPFNAAEDAREAQAQAVDDYVELILTEDPGANVIVLGDFNGFYFEDQFDILKGAHLTNLIETLPENERYSFIFDGNAQSLDHILISNDLTGDSAVDIVHLNIEQVTTPLTASDHDAVVARITLVARGETLIGTQHADTLTGGSGADLIDGRNGRDTLDGAGGSDTVDGGLGDDLIAGGAGADSILGGLGSDTIDAGNGADTVDAGQGSDAVAAGVGDDTVDGGLGSDTIDAADGADSVTAGTGNDAINGGNGDDDIDAGLGSDTVAAGEGADTVIGDAGSDSLGGGNGDDQVEAGLGADTVDGGQGADTVIGDLGSDRLLGGDGADSLSGGLGADTIAGGGDADTIAGGLGGDRFVFAPGHGADEVLDFGLGGDRLDLTAFDFVDAAAALAFAAEVEGGVAFNFGGGDGILLAGLALPDLSAIDFLV